MNVTQYTTNQYGDFVSYKLKPALYMNGVKTAQKIQHMKNSNFYGFGVAITGASCYNLIKMAESERTALLKDIYSKEGLGLSVARLTIGSSDYSAELYSYDDMPDDVDLNSFSIARDEEYILPILKEILAINPDLMIFASPWSPPGWMKTGGSMCGGYMREAYLECYARYMVKFILAYQKHGIRITAVTPQNEPETQQSGRMPACIWHPDLEAAFISLLKKELAKHGLDTEIWMHDHNFDGCKRVDWCLNTHENLKNEASGIAFHYYSGCIEETAFLKGKYPGLKLHFTEGGPRLYDNYATDWCKWSIMISKALNNGYSSFTGWNLMLDETGGPGIGPFFCGGLVTRNRSTGELSYSGQYKAFRHAAPFINRESTIFPLEFGEDRECMFSYPNFPKPLCGSVIEHKNGCAALLLINPNSTKAQVQYFHDGVWWYIELLPETAATVLFEA